MHSHETIVFVFYVNGTVPAHGCYSKKLSDSTMAFYFVQSPKKCHKIQTPTLLICLITSIDFVLAPHQPLRPSCCYLNMLGMLTPQRFLQLLISLPSNFLPHIKMAFFYITFSGLYSNVNLLLTVYTF